MCQVQYRADVTVELLFWVYRNCGRHMPPWPKCRTSQRPMPYLPFYNPRRLSGLLIKQSGYVNIIAQL